MKKKSFIHRIRDAIYAHKIRTTIIIIILICIGYYWYRASNPSSTNPQYVITKARIGTITQTVTGSGQVSASNQIDITSQASGAITSIKVSVGEHVKSGQLIATIDSKQALITLENARLSYEKLVEPPKATDLSGAINTLDRSYGDAYNTISTFFRDMPEVMAGMNDILYGKNTFLSDQQSTALVSNSRVLRDETGVNFDRSLDEYNNLLIQYKTLTRASATSSIEQMLNNAYMLAKKVATTLQKAQGTVNYIVTMQKDYLPSIASTATTNINSWSSTINSDVTSLLSANNTIESNKNTLADILDGTDDLDIKSQQLSLKQAEQTYANYFIRAPFDGIIGRIPVNVYEQAGSQTIATVIGDKKVATISLNEVDAAKVKTGDPVKITFDAIDGLEVGGTVIEVELVGTVTQGVVTYKVKFSIDSDDQRIRPGMSVNATIVTNKINNIVIIPSSAVKTKGKMSYVEIVDVPPSTIRPDLSYGSTTRSTSNEYGNGLGRTMTIEGTTAPREQIVSTGLSDDSNTEIKKGLTEEWVVTRTINSSSSKTTPAPTLFGNLGSQRPTNNSVRSPTVR